MKRSSCAFNGTQFLNRNACVREVAPGAPGGKAGNGRNAGTTERQTAVFINLLLQQSPGSQNPLMSFLPIILIFGIFYFLLFLPMQRQKKQQQKMLAELQPGDEVMTNGGILGTIVKVAEDSLVVRVKPDNLKLEISRQAVANKLGGDQKK
jgi:preprotein translocase subunit YajC